MKSERMKNKTLQFDILMRIVISVSLSFFAIVGYNVYASQKLVLDLAKISIKKQEEAVMDAINSAVEEGSSVKDEIFFLYKVLDFSNELIQKKMLSLVESVEHIDVITLTKNSKDPAFTRAFEIRKSSGLEKYMGVEIPKNSLYTLNIYDNSVNTVIFYDKNLKVLSKTTGRKITSEDLEQNINWPAVYLKNKLPMISYKNSCDKQGEGASIEIETNLKELSLILNNIRISDRARIYIIDGKNNVILDSDNVTGATEKLVNINEFGDIKLITALNESKKSTQFEKISYFTVDGDSDLSSSTPMPNYSNLDWKVVTVISTKDFLEKFNNIEKISFVLSIIVLLHVLFFLYFQIHKLSEPIKYLSIEADNINNLELDDPVYVPSNICEIVDLSRSMRQLKISVNNFSKYIPKALVKRFVETGEEVKIGGKSTNITILFSDVANFTTISEQTPPQELIFQLSEYFESLSSIIIENRGTIDKFIGDAIMAFWGAPDADPDQIIHACRAALVCQQKLKGLNKYWAAKGKPILNTRIGIHTGVAVVGNIGSMERMNYTALGDSVNLAARLEGINKMYGTQIMISEAVRSKLPSSFITRAIDIVAVKGKEKGVSIFELIGLENDSYLTPTSLEIKEFAKRFTEAFNLYTAQEWESALAAFTTLGRDNLYEADKMIPMFIERCETFIKSPPDESWDGVIHLKEK